MEILKRRVNEYINIRVLMVICSVILLTIIILAICKRGEENEKISNNEIETVCTEFIKEITCVDYRTITGYEGYTYFTEKLRRQLIKQRDPKITVSGYGKRRVIKKLTESPEIIIAYKEGIYAEVLAYYSEGIINHKDNIFAVFQMKYSKNNRWEISGFQLDKY